MRSLPKYGVIKTKTTLLHRFLLPNHFHRDYTGKSNGYDCTTKTFGTLLFSHRLTNKTRRYKKYFPIDLLWSVISFKETPMYFFPSNFSLFMLHSLIWWRKSCISFFVVCIYLRFLFPLFLGYLLPRRVPFSLKTVSRATPLCVLCMFLFNELKFSFYLDHN